MVIVNSHYISITFTWKGTGNLYKPQWRVDSNELQDLYFLFPVWNIMAVASAPIAYKEQLECQAQSQVLPSKH